MPELPPLNHRHHDALRLKALLREPSARRDEAAVVLEGPRIIADALDRGVTLEGVYLGPGARQSFSALVARLDAASVPVRDFKEGTLEKIGTTRTPQPVLGVAPLPAAVSLDTVADGLVVLALDVADPGNLGTIVRSAEAAGAVAVVVTGGVDPWNPKVVRGSAGSVFGVPIAVAADAAMALTQLRSRGWRAVGAESSGAVTHTDADLTGSVVLVLGSEAHGIPAAIVAELDSVVRIPMSGAIESLNVSVAASILMFEAARQSGR